ncbi:MalM family protein [Oleiagrimonas sp. C23AA]|uniref:MalM family protein n=1 Tax=Oleiagrimonas sp. C23AA TaxID=2719047 RepID=UPI001420A127|nr:MalM family protein [Oleiagrimonas sp. C23AA]NII09241.1 hypothetical protein [Oleiagrimonas sp. C23AA]
MPLHRSKRLITVALALALSACASSPLAPPKQDGNSNMSRQAVLKKLAKTPTCCGSFADFDFQKALPPKLKRFRIGPGDPVADFNGSRSYFLPLKLPTDKKTPYKVVFKSKLTGGRWLQASYLFAPTVVTLDARFRPIRTEDVQLCEYMGWTDATSGAFGSFTVQDPMARYLVVYSSGQQQNGSTYWEQSPTSYSAENSVQMTAKGSFQIPHGPNGVIYIGQLTDRYRSVLENAICGKPKPTGKGVFSTLRSVVMPRSRHGS